MTDPRRHRLWALLLAALLSAGCAGGPTPEAVAGAVASGPLSAPEPAPIEAGRAPLPGEYAEGIDVLHYDLELSLQMGSPEISGKARIVLTAGEIAIDELALDLSGLAVEEVWVDGVRASIRLDGGKLLVTLPGGSRNRGVITVDVLYGGVPDDGLILRANMHGAPAAFADNWPNRARFWFPSVDRPSDKATATFTVHAPESWRVIANGSLTAPPEATSSDALGGGQGRRTWRWETSAPIPTYTMVVGAADLVVRDVGLAACGSAPRSPRSDGCVEVSYWVFPEDTVSASNAFARAAQMVDFFTDKIGPYPYEKLANVQSATRFGGMENASAIFYSEQSIASGRDIEGTVSHEIAHQWFGDSVTEADWHHLWLSEGFATYFGALFFETADGVERFREMIDESRQRVLGSPDVERPVVDPDEQNLFQLLNDNNYPKGGLVLHMLRGLLGDEAFFAGIRAYYSRFQDGVALTADFRRVMEETSGTDLDWFFQQWLFQPGYPTLVAEMSWDPGPGEALVTIRQTQKSAWPAFRIPLDLEMDVAGVSHRRRIDVTERTQTFRIELDGPPTSVVLDPDGFVLMRTQAAGPDARDH